MVVETTEPKGALLGDLGEVFKVAHVGTFGIGGSGVKWVW